MKEIFCTIFSSFIEHHKRQRLTYKGTKCFLTSIVQAIRSFFWQLRKSRTKYFKIKAIVPKKKNTLALFFSYYPVLQTLGILLLGSTRSLGIYGPGFKINSLGPKRLPKKHFFGKKAIFSVRKCICPVCFRIVECKKPQETVYKIQKVLLTISVEVIRFF